MLVFGEILHTQAGGGAVPAYGETMPHIGVGYGRRTSVYHGLKESVYIEQ